MGQDWIFDDAGKEIQSSRYQLLDSLSSDGNAVVYRAKDNENNGREVAIKILTSDLAQGKDTFERFEQEFCMLQKIKHPNVIEAIDFISGESLVALVMEYFSGLTLADFIEQEGPLTDDEVADIFEKICAGVQAIHASGTIHRDLKPENVLIGPDGSVKIIDLGIGCGEGMRRLTEHGALVGTLDYLSPEYLELGTVDKASDVYGLGLLGYKMVTGKLPFGEASGNFVKEVVARIEFEPPAVRDLPPDFPRWLGEIILKALQRRPEDRFQGAEEMFFELRRSRTHHAVKLVQNFTPSMAQAPSDFGRSMAQAWFPIAFAILVVTICTASGIAWSYTVNSKPGSKINEAKTYKRSTRALQTRRPMMTDNFRAARKTQTRKRTVKNQAFLAPIAPKKVQAAKSKAIAKETKTTPEVILKEGQAERLEVERLFRLLTDENAKISNKFLALKAASKREILLPVLFELSKGGDANWKILVMKTLSESPYGGNEEVLSQLALSLSDKEPNVRGYAAKLLAKSRVERYMQSLELQLKLESDPEVVRVLHDSMAQLRGW